MGRDGCKVIVYSASLDFCAVALLPPGLEPQNELVYSYSRFEGLRLSPFPFDGETVKVRALCRLASDPHIHSEYHSLALLMLSRLRTVNAHVTVHCLL